MWHRRYGVLLFIVFFLFLFLLFFGTHVEFQRVGAPCEIVEGVSAQVGRLNGYGVERHERGVGYPVGEGVESG